jgi:hypothetical protein
VSNSGEPEMESPLSGALHITSTQTVRQACRLSVPHESKARIVVQVKLNRFLSLDRYSVRSVDNMRPK